MLLSRKRLHVQRPRKAPNSVFFCMPLNPVISVQHLGEQRNKTIEASRGDKLSTNMYVSQHADVTVVSGQDSGMNKGSLLPTPPPRHCCRGSAEQSSYRIERLRSMSYHSTYYSGLACTCRKPANPISKALSSSSKCDTQMTDSSHLRHSPEPTC